MSDISRALVRLQSGNCMVARGRQRREPWQQPRHFLSDLLLIATTTNCSAHLAILHNPIHNYKSIPHEHVHQQHTLQHSKDECAEH